MEELPESHDLAPFFALSQDLMAVANTERFLWLSPRWSELLGWTDEELSSGPFLQFVHPDDAAATVEAAAELNRGKLVVQFQNRYRCRDGQYRWLEWNASPRDGRLYCVARDVTERVRVEERLRHRAELVALAEDIFHTGHWYIDLVDDDVFWSPEIYRIHGRDPATFSPSLADGIDAYHPEDRNRVTELVNRAIDQQVAFEFELRIVRPTGEVRRVHSVGRPHHDRTGAMIGILGVFQDITDDPRVRRVEQLEQFAYVAGHDLRSPIRTIRNIITILEEDYELPWDDEGQALWGRMSGAIDRLDRLVKDLASYTRAGIVPTPSKVSTQQVLAWVLNELGPRFEAASGSVDVADDLPLVRAEGSRLGQVVLNLLDNALQYSGARPPRVSVGWEADPGGKTVTLSFRDQGIGFDPSDAERIFEPFRRLGLADPQRTGIGLAIVRQLVEGMGGQVWATGRPGEGATFFVRLDRAPGDGLPR